MNQYLKPHMLTINTVKSHVDNNNSIPQTSPQRHPMNSHQSEKFEWSFNDRIKVTEHWIDKYLKLVEKRDERSQDIMRHDDDMNDDFMNDEISQYEKTLDVWNTPQYNAEQFITEFQCMDILKRLEVHQFTTPSQYTTHRLETHRAILKKLRNGELTGLRKIQVTPNYTITITPK